MCISSFFRSTQLVVAKNAFFEEKDTVEDQEELALGLLIFLQDSPKAKRNITLNQKSNFCPDSRFFSKTSFFCPKKSIWFQAFLDICCCLLICGQKWSFGTVSTRKGEKRCLLHIEGEKMKIDTWTAFGIWLQQTFSFLLFLQQWRGGPLLCRSSSLRIFYLVEAAEAVAGLINKKEKKKNVGYSDMYWNSFGNT